MSPHWSTALPAVQVEIECAQRPHRLHWSHGELSVPDHPEADLERALVGLGADPYPCLEILDSWRRHVTDLDVLLLAARGPADVITPHGERTYSTRVTRRPGGRPVRTRGITLSATGSGSWTGYSSTLSVRFDRPESADDEVVRLLRLGGGLPERLGAAVIASWADRVEQADVPASAQARLHAALYGRVLATVQSWSGEPQPGLTVHMVTAGASPSVERGDSGLVVALPFSWLRDVWVPGFGVVLGRFCLSATADAAGHWTMATLGPDLGAATTISVQT